MIVKFFEDLSLILADIVGSETFFKFPCLVLTYD